MTVGKAKGDWNTLKDEFCLKFFPISKVVALRTKALSFKQREGESLGAAWARFTQLLSSGPDLGIPEAMSLQHFACGLSEGNASRLDAASRGSFLFLTASEGRAILDKILEHTEHTGVYEDLPEKPADRMNAFGHSPSPCPQKVAEPKPPISDPTPSFDHHQSFFSDNDKSEAYSDVPASLGKEDDPHRKSEVVTADPHKESLSNTKNYSPYLWTNSPFISTHGWTKNLPSLNPESQFLKDECEFPTDEFKSSISSNPLEFQESFQIHNLFCDSKEDASFPHPEKSKDFHNEGKGPPQECYMIDIEKVFSVDIPEVATIVSGSEDDEEHGGFIFEKQQDPCLSMETSSLSTFSTHDTSNHHTPYQDDFKKVVMDEFVYHKHCKYRRGLC